MVSIGSTNAESVQDGVYTAERYGLTGIERRPKRYMKSQHRHSIVCFSRICTTVPILDIRKRVQFTRTYQRGYKSGGGDQLIRLPAINVYEYL